MASCSAAVGVSPSSGAQACRSLHWRSKRPSGCNGMATVGMPSGTPGAIAGQSSSLPTKTTADSECSSTWRADSAVRLG
ncbi:Uncharacterised protein [Acinetobacter baumannii]|nr:Uncharacterised protein [Acinetobacter baumannii]